MINKEELHKRILDATQGLSVLDALSLSMSITKGVVESIDSPMAKEELLETICGFLKDASIGKTAQNIFKKNTENNPDFIDVTCAACQTTKIRVHKDKIQYVNLCNSCKGLN